MHFLHNIGSFIDCIESGKMLTLDSLIRNQSVIDFLKDEIDCIKAKTDLGVYDEKMRRGWDTDIEAGYFDMLSSREAIIQPSLFLTKIENIIRATDNQLQPWTRFFCISPTRDNSHQPSNALADAIYLNNRTEAENIAASIGLDICYSTIYLNSTPKSVLLRRFHSTNISTSHLHRLKIEALKHCTDSMLFRNINDAACYTGYIQWDMIKSIFRNQERFDKLLFNLDQIAAYKSLFFIYTDKIIDDLAIVLAALNETVWIRLPSSTKKTTDIILHIQFRNLNILNIISLIIDNVGFDAFHQIVNTDKLWRVIDKILSYSDIEMRQRFIDRIQSFFLIIKYRYTLEYNVHLIILQRHISMSSQLYNSTISLDLTMMKNALNMLRISYKRMNEIKSAYSTQVDLHPNFLSLYQLIGRLIIDYNDLYLSAQSYIDS